MPPWKSFMRNRSQQQQLASSSYHSTQPLGKFPTNTCLRSDFGTQPLSKLNFFLFLDEAMYSYIKTQDSPYDPKKLAIHSIVHPEVDLRWKSGHNLKNMVSFDDIVRFIDEAIIVTFVDFHCGFTFYPEAPLKLCIATKNEKTFPDPVENRSA